MLLRFAGRLRDTAFIFPPRRFFEFAFTSAILSFKNSISNSYRSGLALNPVRRTRKTVPPSRRPHLLLTLLLPGGGFSAPLESHALPRLDKKLALRFPWERHSQLHLLRVLCGTAPWVHRHICAIYVVILLHLPIVVVVAAKTPCWRVPHFILFFGAASSFSFSWLGWAHIFASDVVSRFSASYRQRPYSQKLSRRWRHFLFLSAAWCRSTSMRLCRRATRSCCLPPPHFFS